jgi:hypothetical protein
LRRLLTLAVGSAVLPLAACGTTTIDSGKVEQLVRDNVAAPKPARVDCPDGVKARKGEVFYCKLDYPGRKPATLTVHIESDDGRVSFRPSDLKPGS